MVKSIAARTLLFVSIIAFAFQGCSKNVNLTSPEDAKTGTTQLGKFAVNFDKSEVPTDVNSIKVYLSRKGCDTLKAEIPVIRDSTSQQVLQAAFDSVTAGVWNVQVDAFNSKNEVIFTGSAEIFVASGVLTQVELTMKRIKASVGQVLIKIKWEEETAILWKDYIYNPVLTSSQSNWDMGGVFTPRFIYDDNVYKMWYGGLGSAGMNYIGYAFSTDGKKWIKTVQQPVLKPGAKGQWDDASVQIGAVIKINGTYYMYYNGWGTNSSNNSSIGLATSADGISWTKSSQPVIEKNGDENYLAANSVLQAGNMYYLYYSYINSKTMNWTVGVAFSQNGKEWTRYSNNPILTSTQSWEQNQGVGNVTVYKDGAKYKMVYSGVSALSTTGFGTAESNDGLIWTKSSNNPIFTDKDPSISWNTDRVVYPSYTVIGNQERIYYTGRDKYSGTLAIAYIIKK